MTVTAEQRVSGEAFYTEPGTLTDLIAAAVEAETGPQAELTTGGGTSDARFIKDHCPVAELGLLNEMAHKVDERVSGRRNRNAFPDILPRAGGLFRRGRP